MDIDREFGRCNFNSDEFGGRGYRHNEEREKGDSDDNYISNSELVFVKREDERGLKDDSNELVGENWEWSPGGKRRIET